MYQVNQKDNYPNILRNTAVITGLLAIGATVALVVLRRQLPQLPLMGMTGGATFTGVLSIVTTGFACLNKKSKQVKRIPLFQQLPTQSALPPVREPQSTASRQSEPSRSPPLKGGSVGDLRPPVAKQVIKSLAREARSEAEAPPPVIPATSQLPDLHPAPPREDSPQPLKKHTAEEDQAPPNLERPTTPDDHYHDPAQWPSDDEDEFADAHEELPNSGPLTTEEAVETSPLTSNDKNRNKLLLLTIQLQMFSEFFVDCFHGHNPTYTFTNTNNEVWYAYDSTKRALDRSFTQLQSALFETNILHLHEEIEKLLCLMTTTLLSKDPKNFVYRFALPRARSLGQLNPQVVYNQALIEIEKTIKDHSELKPLAEPIKHIAYYLSPVMDQYLTAGKFQDEIHSLCTKIWKIKPSDGISTFQCFNEEFQIRTT